MGYSVELYSLISNPLSFAIRSLPDSCNGNSPDIWIKHTNSYTVMTTSPSWVRFLPTSHIECLGIPDENLFRGYKHPSDQAARKSNEIISVVVNAITAIVRYYCRVAPLSRTSLLDWSPSSFNLLTTFTTSLFQSVRMHIHEPQAEQ